MDENPDPNRPLHKVTRYLLSVMERFDHGKGEALTTGLDYSAGRISGSTIRNAGHEFVVRYCGTPGRTKNIIRSEFEDLVAHGVTCWLVYEDGTEDAMGGFGGGVAAARAARADADSLGYPPNGVIFFCADRHLAAGEIPTALAYLDGAASVLGREAVGAYGFSEFINAAKAGRASYFWQCGSRSTVGAGVHIYQRNTGYVTVGGIQCDLNDLLIPIGPALPPAAPGGIETMAFGDKFRDWAGNDQDVLSWMNHVDQRISELHTSFFGPGAEPSRIPGDQNRTNLRDAIMDNTSWTNQALGEAAGAHQELTKLYPSGVEGSTYSATAGQMATNADAYGYKLTKRVDELSAKVDQILAALNMQKGA
jgi:hypothetical protein